MTGQPPSVFRAASPGGGWSIGGRHLTAALLALVVLAGCTDAPEHSRPSVPLVLYTSVDEPYARPIIEAFQQETGIQVVLQTDTEATKSAGLAAKLEAERDKPRADVWWGNEVFHTIRLAEAGVLAPYESPAAKDVPARFKDPAHRWAGNGLRARVIATSGVADGGSSPATSTTAVAASIQDLLKPEHKGRVGIARPTAGTTGGHVAALYVLWGKERFADFLRKLKANDVKVLGGNGPVAEAVGRGELSIGLTDNDDVASVLRNGGTSIRSALPDQGTAGTLAIPTTVGLVAGAPNPEAAKRLVDYLLSAAVEARLVEANFAGWSVCGRDANGGAGGGAGISHANVRVGSGGASSGGAIETMDVDFAAVAHAMPDAVWTAMTILEGRE